MKKREVKCPYCKEFIGLAYGDREEHQEILKHFEAKHKKEVKEVMEAHDKLCKLRYKYQYYPSLI